MHSSSCWLRLPCHFSFFSVAGVLLLAGVSHYAEYPWGDYVNVGLDPC